jgi:class 3 adenylate cyclase
MGDTRAVADSDAKLTIDELLRSHPWPEEHATERRLEWLWTIEVALPPSALWPLVSDVSRLNRALGNPEMTFEEKGGARWGRARYSGVLHEWHEAPWNWVAGRWFTMLRGYTRGAMRTLYSVHRLEPIGHDRTRLDVYYGVVPRWTLLIPPLKLSFGKMGRAYRNVIPALAAARPSHPPPVLEAPPPRPLGAAAERRLTEIARRLHEAGLDPIAIDRLVTYVQRGDELELFRIQVRERARAWNVDEGLLLRVFLHATRAGLLELTWDVLCPHCRGVRGAERKLSEVPREASCEVCAVTFGTAEGVEITFRVHPSIRRIEPRLFCSAEPATKPHIHVQRALAPGAQAAVDVELDPGRYRMREHGRDAVSGWLDVAPGRDARAVAWRASEPPGELASPPRAALTLVNDSSDLQTFIIETSQPTDLALRPGRLLSHQEFRDLFSDEFLGANVQLAVGQQTILFTDIVGSTAMYAERGDAAAFATVRRHFDEVFALIARHHGAVVKTIGDAAMGAFTDPLDAVRAAEAIQRAFAAPGGLRLRISLNTDACIAVRLNANIDYFGQAVNLAARLQAFAEGGQIGLSTSTMSAPGVEALLAGERARVRRVAAAVKGLRDPVTAYVWTVHGDDQGAVDQSGSQSQ